MSGLLQVADDGPDRCVHCGRPAAGPCASCKQMICGDCCTITEGSSKKWAICLECDRKGGRSLMPAWAGLLVWLGGILLALALLTVAAAWLAGR